MAISQTGTPEKIESNSTGDHSVTVPSDCTLIVIAYAGWSGAGNALSSASLDSDSFTEAAEIEGGSGTNPGTGLAYLANPSTGSQTLSMTFEGDAVDDFSVVVSYWKGVDTSSPSRDSATAGDYASPVTTPSFDVEDGDVALVAVGTYEEYVDASPTGSGQTTIEEALNIANNSEVGLAYKNITSSGTTTMQGDGESLTYTGVAAFALKPASDGGKPYYAIAQQ